MPIFSKIEVLKAKVKVVTLTNVKYTTEGGYLLSQYCHSEVVYMNDSIEDRCFIAVLHSLFDAARQAQVREDVKAIVLTGASNRFSAGFDIAQFQKSSGGGGVDMAYAAFLYIIALSVSTDTAIMTHLSTHSKYSITIVHHTWIHVLYEVHNKLAYCIVQQLSLVLQYQ